MSDIEEKEQQVLTTLLDKISEHLNKADFDGYLVDELSTAYQRIKLVSTKGEK